MNSALLTIIACYDCFALKSTATIYESPVRVRGIQHGNFVRNVSSAYPLNTKDCQIDQKKDCQSRLLPC